MIYVVRMLLIESGVERLAHVLFLQRPVHNIYIYIYTISYHIISYHDINSPDMVSKAIFAIMRHGLYNLEGFSGH